MNKDYCKHMVPLMKNDTCHICSLEAERDQLKKELEEAKQSIVEEARQADEWHELYLEALKETEKSEVIIRAVRGIAHQPIGVFGEEFGWEFHYKSLKNRLKKVVGQEGEGNQ
ncbi:hypothetical protein [Paenibacillus illinoisensis]|uniref:hypothetical protein n=1 Tax=Paenibacillus illinoisensis TaxID=59845 RepID=UPI0020407227|nr:hypothetical protein [Paenibacillus illinoisensis]MCM3208512.1 hypothetical protein [Paenibacillus illinoisensis]